MVVAQTIAKKRRMQGSQNQEPFFFFKYKYKPKELIVALIPILLEK
jgi:hypothetical protein